MTDLNTDRLPTIRKAAHSGHPLDGSDAQALAGVLYQAEMELGQAQAEIDRLRENQGKVKSELHKWHVDEIEQRTKEACFEAGWKCIKEKICCVAGTQSREHFEKAIDSVGKK